MLSYKLQMTSMLTLFYKLSNHVNYKMSNLHVTKSMYDFGRLLLFFLEDYTAMLESWYLHWD